MTYESYEFSSSGLVNLREKLRSTMFYKSILFFMRVVHSIAVEQFSKSG